MRTGAVAFPVVQALSLGFLLLDTCGPHVPAPPNTFTGYFLPGLLDIDAGEFHTCAIDTANRAYCWGDNSHGQLGTGSVPDLTCTLDPAVAARPCQLSPVPVRGRISFVSISAGKQHTCALEKDSGNVFCWGSNADGQLGNGTTTDSRTPVQVQHRGRFVQVSAGDRHTCALDDQRKIYCWGTNTRGQLGVILPSGASFSTVPILYGSGLEISAMFAGVSAGKEHTCATNGGTIRCWGENTYGQLGIGTSGVGSGGAGNQVAVNGVYPSNLSFRLQHSFSAGGDSTCALRTLTSGLKGANCWGANDSGQLGGGYPAPFIAVPQPVAAPGAANTELIWEVASGQSHMCVITKPAGASSPVPACAGSGSHGQRGDGSVPSSTVSRTPVRVYLATPNKEFFRVTVGSLHSCALEMTGRLNPSDEVPNYFGSALCWGSNSFGQVGKNFGPTWSSPTYIDTFIPTSVWP